VSYPYAWEKGKFISKLAGKRRILGAPYRFARGNFVGVEQKEGKTMRRKLENFSSGQRKEKLPGRKRSGNDEKKEWGKNAAMYDAQEIANDVDPSKGGHPGSGKCTTMGHTQEKNTSHVVHFQGKKV